MVAETEGYSEAEQMLRSAAESLLTHQKMSAYDLGQALNLDLVSVDVVLDGLNEVMQRDKGEHAEFRLRKSLPCRTKFAIAIGKSEWEIRSTGLENT